MIWLMLVCDKEKTQLYGLSPNMFSYFPVLMLSLFVNYTYIFKNFSLCILKKFMLIQKECSATQLQAWKQSLKLKYQNDKTNSNKPAEPWRRYIKKVKVSSDNSTSSCRKEIQYPTVLDKNIQNIKNCTFFVPPNSKFNNKIDYDRLFLESIKNIDKQHRVQG